MFSPLRNKCDIKIGEIHARNKKRERVRATKFSKINPKKESAKFSLCHEIRVHFLSSLYYRLRSNKIYSTNL